MLGIVFYYEDPAKNIYSNRTAGDVEIWRGCARSWGCTHFFMIDLTPDESGINAYEHHDTKSSYARYKTLGELEDAYPDAEFVYTAAPADLQKAVIDGIPHHEFEHPEGDTIYVFGPDSASVDIKFGRAHKTWIYVPCDCEAWAITIAGAVMSDRYIKHRWLCQ